MDSILLVYVLHLEACFIFTTGADWSTLIVTHFILPVALHASSHRLASFTADVVLEPNCRCELVVQPLDCRHHALHAFIQHHCFKVMPKVFRRKNQACHSLCHSKSNALFSAAQALGQCRYDQDF